MVFAKPLRVERVECKVRQRGVTALQTVVEVTDRNSTGCWGGEAAVSKNDACACCTARWGLTAP